MIVNVMNSNFRRLFATLALCLTLPIRAATLIITANTPTPGPYDIYNFTGAPHDGVNVSDGGAYTDGAANDVFTYVAGDRADQGQTFTTGTNTGGYELTTICLRHAGYTNNTDLTWWAMNSGATITVRITDPSLAGTTGFAMDTETYITTGTEGWSGVQNSSNGDGDWVQITLSSPVALSPNKTYGFDVTSATTGAFFEWLGTTNNVYSGGVAYNGSTLGQPDNTLNGLAGDRVFLVALSLNTNLPGSPATLPALVAIPFSLTNVTLLPSQFQTNMLVDKMYLLSLDPDRLLYTFRTNVNLSTSNAVPYGGWEAPGDTLCLGHFLGHYLSACSMMYASTGDPLLKTRTDYLVRELAKCQAASPAAGFNPGYLAAFPESYIDDLINESQNSYFSVPWYTLHKVMAGLLDTYQITGNNQALSVLTNMANWVQFRMDPLTASQIQSMLNYREYGGMNEVMANLYAITGNTNYLRIAADFDKQSLFVPLSQDQDVLDGLHANTQIPEIIGAAREYELTGSTNEHEIASFFWNRVANYRSFIIGLPGDNEFFFPTSTFALHLAPSTAETCNGYNMLKLTRHLFSWSPNAAYMDYYEEVLYNDILASQDSSQGMMTYFMSLKPGHFKTYSTPGNSFWCCEGTGAENHSKYNDTIYFHGTNSLYVNLFIPSQLNWPDKGLTVTQNTAFPQSNTSTLTFQCSVPVPLPLEIRYPSWAQSGMSIAVNGTPQTITNAPGSYVAINRTWQNGDQVQIQLPMQLRTEPLPGNSNVVAILYGPILLAGALGTNGMPASDFAVNQGDYFGVADPLVPMLIGDTNGLLRNTLPVANPPLTFKTQSVAQPTDVTLVPFYQIQHQRYSIYWNLLSSNAWQQFAYSNAVAEATVIDQVNIGDPVSEAAHNIVANNSSTGAYNGLNWRDANGNLSKSGSFSYTLAILAGVPANLACTYWGSDTGNRTFDILVNGTVIATQYLTNNSPGQFFTVNYPMPTNLISAAATNLTVKFNAHSHQIAGGLFGLQSVTSANPGAFLGIQLTAPTTQAYGVAAQPLNITDYFQSMTNHSVAASPWLTLTSSDTNIINVASNNQLTIIGPGVCTITASYLGYTVSRTITVETARLSMALRGTNAFLSWPSNSATLQSAASLGATWSAVGAPIVSATGTNTALVPATNAARYFRLSY